MRLGLLVVLTLLALSGCSRSEVATEGAKQVTEETVSQRAPKPWADFERNLEAYSANPVSISRQGHPGGTSATIYCSPWANEALAKLVSDPRTWPGEFRTGSLIVLKQQDGTVYVMRKRPLGRLPLSKDWFFALEREGRVVLQTGVNDDRIQQACIECHRTLGAKTDWVVPPKTQRERLARSR